FDHRAAELDDVLGRVGALDPRPPRDFPPLPAHPRGLVADGAGPVPVPASTVPVGTVRVSTVPVGTVRVSTVPVGRCNPVVLEATFCHWVSTFQSRPRVIATNLHARSASGHDLRAENRANFTYDEVMTVFVEEESPSF